MRGRRSQVSKSLGILYFFVTEISE